VEQERQEGAASRDPIEPRAALIERVVADLGFELVTLERGGGRRRPLLRLRVDRPESEPGRSSITVDDCAAVSRAVRAALETEDGDEVEYILEVSSPGVERPLTRPRDFERFAGQVVRIRGYAPFAERGRRLEGVLLGISSRDSDAVALEVGGEKIQVPMQEIATAKLVYRWEDDL
jgi:ribosome maturation factor RimP